MNLLDGAVQMGAGLVVHVHHHGTELGSLLNVIFRVLYHKVNIDDEHLGFIKLGSRVDVYLPVGTEVCVKMGQSTTGDQTIIAKLK